jgi:hypothetical protein
VGVQIFSLCDPTVHGFSSCPAAGQTFGITDVPKNFAQATEQEDLCFKLVFLAAWYGSVPFSRKMIPIRSESCQALRFVGMISLLAVLLLVVQGLMQIELEASGSFIWSFATVRLKGFYVVGELSKNAGVRGADIFSSVKLIALLQCGSFGSCHQGSLPFAQ